VEDHALERADGGFGYIDSYLYLYRLDAEPKRLAAINASEQRVITPKAVDLWEDGPRLGITTAGYGGSRQVLFSWADRAFDKPPQINAWDTPPGAADGAYTEDGAWITASSLLDAWVIHGAGTEVQVVPAGKPSTRTLDSRLGELLFFTEMMAPWGKTDGPLSRFTCETCHHEGYTDGRTHFTGREHGGLKVHASTRPLLGLFNNAPYFSRALDQSMTQMVHSEFKVANRHNGRDPWFELTTLDIKWLHHVVGREPLRLSAEKLRAAFMAFLIDFTHRRNPAADHAAFTAAEKRGAEVFRDRCASCHDARLIAEDPNSAVPFERWEKLVLSPPGPLVWNTAEYAKTGVLPYVHEDGARIPTLRRLYKKWPYFTNGSAKSLAEVVDRFAYDARSSLHDQGAPAMTRLPADDKAALLAFLDLL
nr:c-type cytochrome [Deltaproteobacteria bacterium]